jgi:hypothetical protein
MILVFLGINPKSKSPAGYIPSGLTKSNEAVIRFNESISTQDRVNGGYLS